MPSNGCLGLDDDETDLPVRPQTEKGNPEGAINRGEPRVSEFVRVDRDLLTEGKLDGCLLALTAKQGGDRAEVDPLISEEWSDHVTILEGRSSTV